jgi:RNA polymerase sigma factor (sigma-70 family)
MSACEVRTVGADLAMAVAAEAAAIGESAGNLSAGNLIEQAVAYLALRGGPSPEFAGASAAVDPRDAVATRLMDQFRRDGDPETFDWLVRLTRDHLLRRARRRTRDLGGRVDPAEVVQDTFVNVYRYPDRFEARRPSAFRIWSATILDNVVRRQLRRRRNSCGMQLRSAEELSREPDPHERGPEAQAIQGEDRREAGLVYLVFLQLYLSAFTALGDRERYVLEMVEVRGLRYQELAGHLGLRPEALKMVVFRARRRIFDRVRAMLPATTSDSELHRTARGH